MKVSDFQIGSNISQWQVFRLLFTYCGGAIIWQKQKLGQCNHYALCSVLKCYLQASNKRKKVEVTIHNFQISNYRAKANFLLSINERFYSHSHPPHPRDQPLSQRQPDMHSSLNLSTLMSIDFPFLFICLTRHYCWAGVNYIFRFSPKNYLQLLAFILNIFWEFS